jgi:hypothetical protein
MRLHGLILARAVGARAACVPYSALDQKTTVFAASEGQAVARDGEGLWKTVCEWVKKD